MDHGERTPITAETTEQLLARIRRGDAAAREQLLARYWPALRRWARGRLPAMARGIGDTEDLVQVTLLKALDKMSGFEPRGPGSFMAYVRKSLLNRRNDWIRAARRRPQAEELPTDLPLPGPSPLERAIGRERLEAYEEALATLPETQQEAVVLRVEMGFTHAEVANAVGCPSPNAARMMVARALVRLAEVMDEQANRS